MTPTPSLRPRRPHPGPPATPAALQRRTVDLLVVKNLLGLFLLVTGPVVLAVVCWLVDPLLFAGVLSVTATAAGWRLATSEA